MFLTTSCTDALEMAALLCNIQPGDEVIIPSYTFVSTANAFILRGAKIVFVDSRSDHPGMDETKLEALITSRTKVIVPVHYSGIACDMDRIMEIAKRHNLLVIEDAAQAVESYYHEKPLGGIGHLGCISFHETKGIHCGEGGMLIINDEQFLKRAEIIWEKGTNRTEFFRGEINKYGWMDIGSSFYPSEITAAFLFAQLEHIDIILQKHKQIWNQYYNGFSTLKESENIRLPVIPNYSSNNGNIFYLLCSNMEQRTTMISNLKEKGISCVFHFLTLNQSPYALKNLPENNHNFPNSDHFEKCLVRLPFYFDLSENEIHFIIEEIQNTLKNIVSIDKN